MKRVLVKPLILLVMILFIGCSHSYTVNKYEEMNLRDNAIIETKAGLKILVANTVIKQDSVHATENPSGQGVHLHASEINRIVQKRNDALKYGLLGAAGVAGWVVLTAGEWNDEDNSGYTIFWSGVLGVPAGGLGYLLGSTHRYEYYLLFETNETTARVGANP